MSLILQLSFIELVKDRVEEESKCRFKYFINVLVVEANGHATFSDAINKW